MRVGRFTLIKVFALNTNGDDRINFSDTDESGVDIYMELDPGQTRQFIAFVKKDYTVCAQTDKQFGSKLMVEVDAAVIDGCSKNAIKAGDQNIFFTNKGNKKIAFTATVKSFN